MSSANWTYLTAGLDISSLDRGVTAGITPPPAGGSFVFGFNSLSVVTGAAGLFTNQASFAPMAKGSSVRGVVQRLVSGGPTNFSPYLFSQAQGSSVNDLAYLLGLQDGEPHQILLRKGTIVGGCPAGAVGAPGSGILARSTQTFAAGTWLHLRLDAVVNLNGDVVLNAYRSDFTAGGTTILAPNWQPIPGINQIIDDTLHINTGSAPYTSGRAGFGFTALDVSRRGAFAHVEVLRQL